MGHDRRGRSREATPTRSAPSRRAVLTAGTAALAWVAGCAGATSNEHGVTASNAHDRPHRISVAVSPHDDHGLVYDGDFEVPAGGRATGTFRIRAIRRKYRLSVWLDGNADNYRSVVTLDESKTIAIVVDDEGDLTAWVGERP